MSNLINISKPIIGRTYTLYGGELSTDNFFNQLSISTDEILSLAHKSESELLDFIFSVSPSKRRIKQTEKNNSVFSSIMRMLRNDFSKYLDNVEEHLKSISFLQLWDRRLSTSLEQYLLYIIEIELTNRINLEKFSHSKTKLAFLPHCLRDFTRECLSSSDQVDHLCKGCSKNCTINSVSKLLKKSDITPYIWMKADLKKLFQMYQNQNNKIGVLGIACIPELVIGMRLCRKFKVAVIGIPLDANRCKRWMGDFYENSINVDILEKMITNNKGE